MKKALKILFVLLLLAFVAIQFVPVVRSNPPVEDDIRTPKEVDAILRRSCYDCHSNETRWPWYSYVAPVSWLVAKDVEEGREDLNFSRWSQGEQEVDEILEEVQKGKMPMKIYLTTHPGAKMGAEDVAVLEKWIADGAPTGVQ